MFIKDNGLCSQTQQYEIDEEDQEVYKHTAKELYDHSTFPMVFLNSKFIGGCEDSKKILEHYVNNQSSILSSSYDEMDQKRLMKKFLNPDESSEESYDDTSANHLDDLKKLLKDDEKQSEDSSSDESYEQTTNVSMFTDIGRYKKITSTSSEKHSSSNESSSVQNDQDVGYNSDDTFD